MKIRAVVVDDEPLALEGVVALLGLDPEIEVIDACSTGEEAISAILDSQPDLVILDVQMPGLNGFDVIRAVGADNMPLVIFNTAYDRYALRAFEVNAIEYLLKPFTDERFADAVGRAKRALKEKKLARISESLSGLLSGIGDGVTTAPSDSARVRRIAVKTGTRSYFIPVTEIDWIEGADYCAKIHAAGRGHLVRESLTSLASRLDSAMFCRVHRSAIVNVSRVREIQTSSRHEATAVLSNGAKIRIARGRRAALEAMIEGAA